jgi:hypothetical protein
LSRRAVVVKTPLVKLIAPLAAVMLAGAGPSAAIVIVDFNGPPAQARGTQFAISSYVEDDFLFKPLGPIRTSPPYQLARNGGGHRFYPENGSAYLQLLIGNSLEFYHLGGLPFALLSIDLAEYSTLFDYPKSISFKGIRQDGSEVTHSFLTDGVIDGGGPLADFQTFTFPGTFSGLVRVEALDVAFSLDNLVIAMAPTGVADGGSTMALLGGVAAVWLLGGAGARIRARDQAAGREER